MTGLTWTRGAIYIAGMAAGFLELSGYATFENGVLDVHPFNVNNLVVNVVQTVAAGLAALAVWRGWGGKKWPASR